jgi:hypothetical protein
VVAEGASVKVVDTRTAGEVKDGGDHAKDTC